MLKFLKNPPVLILLLIYLFTIILVIFNILIVTNYLIVSRFLSYIIYALGFIFLTYSIASFCLSFKEIKDFFIKILSKNKITNRLIKEYDFRTAIFSLCSLTLNLCFVAYYLGFAIFTFSYWFIVLAIYYFLLFLAREITLYNYHKNSNKRAKIISVYKLCGILLLFLPLYLVAMIRKTIYNDRNINYIFIHTIVMCVVIFYKLIMSIYNYFKSRKTRDLITRSLRNINLAEALISLLTLESSMLYTYGDINDLFSAYMIAYSSFVIAIITIILGISMIIRAKKERKYMAFEGGIYELERFYRTGKE